MKKNISYLTVCLLLIISVLYTSHSALAVVCESECGDFPTSTPIPFPTIVFPTVELPFPTPTDCLTPTPVECREDCTQPTPSVTRAPSPTADPTATPTPGQGLTHTVGDQGDGRGDGRGGTSSTDTGGQVLGLASAGTFADSVMNSVFMLGIACVTLGLQRMYAIQKKS